MIEDSLFCRYIVEEDLILIAKESEKISKSDQREMNIFRTINTLNH
jgi:hypothetical protein